MARHRLADVRQSTVTKLNKLGFGRISEVDGFRPSFQKGHKWLSTFSPTEQSKLKTPHKLHYNDIAFRPCSVGLWYQHIHVASAEGHLTKQEANFSRVENIKANTYLCSTPKRAGIQLDLGPRGF